MGRSHCIDSNCATVWVKEPKQDRRGTHVKYAYDGYYQTEQASHYTLIDNTSRCATPLGIIDHQSHYDRLIAQLSWANANNPPGNELNNTIRFDRVALGDEVEGVYQINISKFGWGDYRISGNGQILFEGLIEGAVQTVNEEYAYGSVREGGTPIYRVYVNQGCQMQLVGTSVGQRLGITRLNSQYKGCDLILHNLNGIENNNKTITTLYRPSYLELLNAQETLTWKQYKVEKEPYRERIEVVNFYYSFNVGGLSYLVNPTNKAPSHCLNIYKTPNIFPEAFNYLNPLYSRPELIAQFCNPKPNATTPLEYYVVCNCQEQCPDNTCSIECGNHICCYDSNGIAVMSIPKLQPPT